VHSMVDVMVDFLTCVQLPIQSVTVDHPLGKKNLNPPPFVFPKPATCLHVKLPPCTIRRNVTLCYTYNCHPVLLVNCHPLLYAVYHAI